MGIIIIKKDGKWSQTADALNQNFASINTEVIALKKSTIRFKGYFTSSAVLTSNYPYPIVGDYAWVGATYPGVVYQCVNVGVWASTAVAPASNTVALGDYVTKTSNETITGEKTFSLPPIVPNPTMDNHAVSKQYVEDTRDVYNVDAKLPLGAGLYYTSDQARSVIDSSIRKVGLKLMYATAIKEIDTLTVAIPTTSLAGTLSITLNGVVFPVTLVAGKTAIQVADQIRAMNTFTGWTTGGTNGTNVVTFNKNTVGKNQAPSFVGGTTTVTGSFTITAKGQLIDWIEEQYVGSTLDNTAWNKASNWKRNASTDDVSVVSTNAVESVATPANENMCDFTDASGKQLFYLDKNGVFRCKYPNGLRGKKISLLGDSISTFTGYIPTGNRTRYPQSDLLTDVNLTYWMRLIKACGMTLGINESWAGTCIANSSAWTTNTGDVGVDRCICAQARINNLGNNGTPNLILVYGGTNDIAYTNNVSSPIPLGTFDYTNPIDYTPTQIAALNITTFAGAVRAMLIRLLTTYPTARVVVLLPSFTSSYYGTYGAKTLDEHNEVLKEACDYFGVKWIDTRTTGLTIYNRAAYLPDGIHPNANGMLLLYQLIRPELEKLFLND